MTTDSLLTAWWGTPGLTREVANCDFPDDSLCRLRRQYLRDAEDAEEDGQKERARVERAYARGIKAEQHKRFALRMRYGACWGGTDVLHRYEAHNEPPSYRLAILIDLRIYLEGRRRSLLAWTPELAERHAACFRMPEMTPEWERLIEEEAKRQREIAEFDAEVRQCQEALPFVDGASV